MKFVVDMNLSPEWALMLSAAGYETVHWSQVGEASAADDEILVWAQHQGRVILTSDLDFGTILAASGQRLPSVIQLRTGRHRPDQLEGLLLNAIEAARAELAVGAFLTIDPKRHRLRVLPLIDRE